MREGVQGEKGGREGGYGMETEEGEGGMGKGYLDEDIKKERKVEQKVMKPELATVVGAERFLAEMKTTANPSIWTRGNGWCIGVVIRVA